MTLELPPFQYIVYFLAAIVVGIVIAMLLARLNGYQEK